MKTTFFIASGLLALVGMGVANPVAQGNRRPRPESFNNEDVEQPGGPRGGDRSRLADTRKQEKPEDLVYICVAGQQADIGNICDQCQGTPVQDPKCSPAQQGCKVKDKSCFTDQKCQQQYGQEAKAQQCGKQQPLQNNQLLSTNQEEQQPRPEDISENGGV